MRQLDGLKEKTNEELLAMYDRDRQLEVKQELTLRYLYIAKAVAIQMHNLYADGGYHQRRRNCHHEGNRAV